MSAVTLSPRFNHDTAGLEADNALARAASARSQLIRAVSQWDAGTASLQRACARLEFGIDRLVEHRASWLLSDNARNRERLLVCANLLVTQAAKAMQACAAFEGRQRGIQKAG